MAMSLKFGTSGLRGLSTELAGAEARRYVTAFLHVLAERGEPLPSLYLGRDFRVSSPAILRDCAAAAAALGIKVIDCGAIPTPALAAHAIAVNAASIMVTGSHIPQDRNGLKFYTRRGGDFEGGRGGHSRCIGAGTRRRLCRSDRGRSRSGSHALHKALREIPA